MASPKQIETLPDITALTALSELQRSRSIMVVSRPEYWNVTADQYQDLTERMIQRAAPENFRHDLIGASRRVGKFVVDYELDSGTRQTVTLNPYEYRAIQRPFDSSYLSTTVDSVTRAGKYSLLSVEALDDKSHSNQVTALMGKYNVMKKRTDGLGLELSTLTHLEEATYNYYRNRGHTSKLRVEAGNVLGSMIPNMLRVVGHQRNWDSAQTDLAKRSLEHRLFFTLPERERMHEWNSLMKVLIDYDEHKITAFQERMGRIQGYLKRISCSNCS